MKRLLLSPTQLGFMVWMFGLVAAVPGQEPARKQTEGLPVKVQMHNVMYHFTDTVAVHIRSLGGELEPAGALPVFDERNSFTLHIASAEIAITPKALAEVLNSYVFAASNAPVKDISLRIDKGLVQVKGKLHRHDDIGFEAEGELTPTSDGKIRLHLGKMRALHLPVQGLMDLFGVEVADLIKTGKVRGVQVEKDDLILDTEQVLPPPHIVGKVTKIHLENDNIVQVFGGLEAYHWAPAPAKNYMAYRGNRLRFGKLTMDDTDMVLIDNDARDPFDFYLDRYPEQLEAGYTKITKNFGLRVFMVDFNKLKLNKLNLNKLDQQGKHR
ncbi:MAG TPA: hypothetical protein VN176_09120 [Verrucomicrobiae bacterium]|jgi:hypothetical protein|nr:hypothetical protein [Verrucomicrobiae bacterium]